MENNFYKTRDLAEAAALLIEKQPLQQIDRESGICWFIFGNADKCKDLSQKFFFEGLFVNAREFHEAMKRLKSRIFTM